jgi:outer membrane protein assembly factor BamB
LFCYDAEAGTLLWTHEARAIPGSPTVPPKVTSDTGYAASTPATDGTRVFAIFATGDLIATDFRGNRLWAKNLGVPENMYGYCSSLLVAHNRLIIQYDNEDAQTLFCLDTATGAPVWQQKRPTMISWSSPTRCVTSSGREVIVLVTCTEAEAYDLETGARVGCSRSWEARWRRLPPAPTEWRTSPTKMPWLPRWMLMPARFSGRTAMPCCPTSPRPSFSKTWSFCSPPPRRSPASTPPPEKILWEKDLKEGFYSSPLVLTDRIAAFDLKGTLFVIKPDRSELLIDHQESLGEGVLSTPAVVGPRMWVRGARHLFCLEREGAPHDHR